MAPTPAPDLPTLARGLQARARAAHQRLTLVLAGSPDWGVAAARTAVAALTPPAGGTGAEPAILWLSDRDLGAAPGGRGKAGGVWPLEAGTRLVGSECDLLVYDAWSGFDPDGFGAVTGTLRGGGLLLLLTPPWGAWPGLPDPQAERIAVWPHRAEAVAGRFLARLVRVLADAPGLAAVREGETLPDPGVFGGPLPDRAARAVARLPSQPPDRPRSQSPTTHPDPGQPATPDQARAVVSVLRLARGRARRPLVLTAHRGRGKSAALGIAAALLMAEGPCRILATAPRREACETLLRHAGGLRPQPGGPAPGTLSFLPPDAILATRPPADLLLVDEAAGIPAPLLDALLGLYPRAVFATTVHGYEGTGRGFDLRFRATLERRTPGWRGLTLETPIRWSPGDPLERLAFRALLLDAEAGVWPHPAPDAPPHPGPGPGPQPEPQPAAAPAYRFARLDRDRLGADEDTLGQVFGLLVLAHYQTRPLDLRMLLDGPGVRVYALLRDGRVAGTLIAAAEGGIADPGLRQAIFEGTRRPRGHLLPQTLSAHGGLPQAPGLRYLRVVRIAVEPGLARRGLGRLMLGGLLREARREGFDALGTSFGATPGLIGFWAACGYRPALAGTSRNAASGEHALAMLRGSSPAGRALARLAEGRLAERLAVLLPGPLRRLDPRVAAALIAAIRTAPPSQPVDPDWGPDGGPDGGPAWDPEVRSFATGHRTLESALPALSDLTRDRLGPALRAGALGADDAALLIAATRQLRPLQELTGPFAAAGRGTLLQRLRGLIGTLARWQRLPRRPAGADRQDPRTGPV